MVGRQGCASDRRAQQSELTNVEVGDARDDDAFQVWFYVATDRARLPEIVFWFAARDEDNSQAAVSSRVGGIAASPQVSTYRRRCLYVDGSVPATPGDNLLAGVKTSMLAICP